MSRLSQSNGDDYPDAARKHLEDAAVLLSGHRFDGVAYLSGYVVECAMKTLIQVETGTGSRSHDLAGLDRSLAMLAARVGAQTARFYARAAPLLRDPNVLAWEPATRYRGPAMTQPCADALFRSANDIYNVIIGGLILDGVL